VKTLEAGWDLAGSGTAPNAPKDEALAGGSVPKVGFAGVVDPPAPKANTLESVLVVTGAGALEPNLKTSFPVEGAPNEKLFPGAAGLLPVEDSVVGLPNWKALFDGCAALFDEVVEAVVGALPNWKTFEAVVVEVAAAPKENFEVELLAV